VRLVLLLFPLLFLAMPLRAAGTESRLTLPAEVRAQVQTALERIFHGDSDTALGTAHTLESLMPEHPIGYLLETEARWWKIYCEVCSIKYNLIDAWERPKLKQDDAYFALADRAIRLAESQLTRHESAEWHSYAGMGYGLKARLHGLRGESLAVARAGVRGRTHFLRALELDPQMGDALTGMGLYNYLSDALSAFAKVMRFFMRIPGGSKKEGIRQLETAMITAELTAAEARFYLARNLRNFDQKYERATELLEPLAAHYPDNPAFQLLLGDMYAKLARKDPATLHFRAAQHIEAKDAACAGRIQQIAAAALAALSPRKE
jgi:tetratricopeptide (TPR) repeat protein